MQRSAILTRYVADILHYYRVDKIKHSLDEVGFSCFCDAEIPTVNRYYW